MSRVVGRQHIISNSKGSVPYHLVCASQYIEWLGDRAPLTPSDFSCYCHYTNAPHTHSFTIHLRNIILETDIVIKSMQKRNGSLGFGRNISWIENVLSRSCEVQIQK